MTTNWPPLDLHAHVDPGIDSASLLNLRSVIFAASRSLAESGKALGRQPSDLLTIWGVGVHPGIKSALDSYTVDEFRNLLGQSAYIGEIGLDGKVPSRLPKQREVLASILSELQKHPRLTSIHSYAATAEVVDELARTPVVGAVLHWWTGDAETTQRAVDLGAYFSVNAASVRKPELLSAIPIDRILPETDHPDGNRYGSRPRQPGSTADVELALARHHGVDPADMRLKVWQNLACLVAATNVESLLPRRVSAILTAARHAE